MKNGMREARKALGRGAPGEALVLLWNEVEPARIAGDRRRLGAIAGLAQRIQREGDEGEQREAVRLLETVRGTVEDEGIAPATSRLDADVSAAGETYELDPAGGASYDLEQEEESAGRSARIGNLVWLALVLLIVIVNVVGQLRN